MHMCLGVFSCFARFMVRERNVYLCGCKYISMRAYVYTYTSVDIYIYVYIFIYIYIQIYMCIYMRIYICIYRGTRERESEQVRKTVCV